ncbi:MAG: glycoside hydrolase family 95 protein [Chitinophagaceae bacterium]|nr:glycoside hydrolase family 95 protein [Chitinophagaceae bacterium]
MKTSALFQKTFVSLLCFLSIATNQTKAQFDPSTGLWYKDSVDKWEDALPIGNGRLGGMYFGNVHTDRLQFNEDTYWSGGPYSTVKKGGYKVLPQLQQLLFEKKFVEGHLLFGKYLLGNPVEQQKYQNMGNLVLNFNYTDTINYYKRTLDLSTGIASISYEHKGVTYTRELFSSFPDQAIVMRITANKAGSINLQAELQGVRNQTHSNYATDYFSMEVIDSKQLKLSGKSADYLGVKGQLRYEARLVARVKGGTTKKNVQSIEIEGADEVVIILVAATNFNNYKDVSANAAQRVADYLKSIEHRSYEAIKADHIKEHKALFGRVELELPTTAQSFLPTNERIQKVHEGADPSFAALGYQFGRYIMMGSSRPGTQASNLQGIWNNDQNPWWDSKYTTNINTQMNYWNVDAGNLSECSQPLFDLIREVSDQGKQVAKEHYGVNEGWVFHQNTDIWRVAAPMDGSNWGAFTTGGAWLCTHIWEHFLYTRDTAFLRKNYALLKGNVQFFLKFLVKDPVHGWLVTNPSTSPENVPGSPGNTRFFDEMNGAYYNGSQICYGSTIDEQILTDLFGYMAQATEVLKIDTTFKKQVLKARAALAPMQIGRDGTLQEWIEDWPQTEKNHRHFSHLYGLYPGHVISPLRTPELIEPVKKVLEQRGDGASGWSRVWKMCEWARLFDGNRANKIFKGYIQEQCTKSLFGKCYAAMQVDASFGLEAAVNEMLVQSQEGFIQLLPALPDEWKAAGSFRGVITRGAFELNFQWQEGRVSRLKVVSRAGMPFTFKFDHVPTVLLNGKPVTIIEVGNGLYRFETARMGNYEIN